MRDTDECVEMVKELTAELFREQRELVERLNTLHRGIEDENHPVLKVRRKVEWMEEKERSIEQLNKVPAFPTLLLTGFRPCTPCRTGCRDMCVWPSRAAPPRPATCICRVARGAYLTLGGSVSYERGTPVQ